MSSTSVITVNLIILSSVYLFTLHHPVRPIKMEEKQIKCIPKESMIFRFKLKMTTTTIFSLHIQFLRNRKYSNIPITVCKGKRIYTLHLIQKFVSNANLSPFYQKDLSTNYSVSIPSSVVEALDNLKWKKPR